MSKATKIVATIGPATETEETIEQLISAGMNVARFNTKHSTPEWHQERIRRVRRVAERLNAPIGILLDLQGPEIRINLNDGKPFDLAQGEQVTFLPDGTTGEGKVIFIPQKVIDAVQVGDSVLIDDGLGEMAIVAHDQTSLIAEACTAFTVNNRKTLNTPGCVIDLPSLIEMDLRHLDGVTDNDIDFVGLSFVRNARDIQILRDEMAKRNLHAAVIAKIENQEAINNLDEIIEAADAVMVARGDLAVEVPFEQLTHWQKTLVYTSRLQSKPVIVATQMLKSMVANPRPTRAEVSDVANAVYDGTDAVMLSEETTIGKYPVRAVEAQRDIARYNEPFATPPRVKTVLKNTGEYITRAAVKLYEDSLTREDLKIDKIVLLTETGTTARAFARFRPHGLIHALTSEVRTYRQLSLVYGVQPYIIDLAPDTLESSPELIQKILELGIAQPGENVLLIHGTFWKKPGLTNTLSILTLPTE